VQQIKYVAHGDLGTKSLEIETRHEWLAPGRRPHGPEKHCYVGNGENFSARGFSDPPEGRFLKSDVKGC
jgi:hypothetical protein